MAKSSGSKILDLKVLLFSSGSFRRVLKFRGLKALLNFDPLSTNTLRVLRKLPKSLFLAVKSSYRYFSYQNPGICLNVKIWYKQNINNNTYPRSVETQKEI
jgi:hypothetical protein